jgi:hypothetical protein
VISDKSASFCKEEYVIFYCPGSFGAGAFFVFFRFWVKKKIAQDDVPPSHKVLADKVIISGHVFKNFRFFPVPAIFFNRKDAETQRPGYPLRQAQCRLHAPLLKNKKKRWICGMANSFFVENQSVVGYSLCPKMPHYAPRLPTLLNRDSPN